MGQFNVSYIIAVALPALMIIYPITIVLILLNVLPEKYANPKVFKAVVTTTILFSIPDFLATMGSPLAPKGGILEWIPLQQYSLGWVLPALVVFLVVNAIGFWEESKIEEE
jgi:LIVCS family branched-chain amino acid:cation transporter